MYDPLRTLVTALERGGFDPRATGEDRYESRCPGHDGRRHNLTVARGEDARVLVHCQAHQCSLKTILEPLGLEPKDLFPQIPPDDRGPIGKPRRSPRTFPTAEAALSAFRLGNAAATWTYRSTNGSEVLKVARFTPKTFRPLHAVAEGWRWGDPPGPLPLYGLPELKNADRVFVGEGEGCADVIRGWGLHGTTSAHGARSAPKTDWGPLASKEVVILPDNDAPGQAYGASVVKLLEAVSPRPVIKIVRLSDLPEGGDVVDWARAMTSQGWTDAQCRAELERLANEAPAVNVAQIRQESATAAFGDNPPPPRPIRVTLRPVPPLDPRLIPDPLRDWLTDIADRVGCPLEFPTVGAIVFIGSIVGRRIGIRPKRFDDWTVVPNLWGMAVARSGMLKSPALQEALSPLRRLEARSREQHTQAVQEFAIAKEVAQAKAAAAKTALKTAAKNEKADPAKLRELAAQAQAEFAEEPPKQRRFVLNDATVEKLGEILRDSPTGVLEFRDELPGFLKGLDKEGRESDRAFYLESWNGTSDFVYDRVGRGTVFIASAVVSIFGGIQPGPLARYVRSSASGDNDDGLLPRFQLAVYPDQGTDWCNVDRWPDTEAKSRAYTIFEALADLDAGLIGAQIDEHDSHPIPYLRFSDEAQGFFNEWRTHLETVKLRNDLETPVLESHLAKFRSLMPSLALLFHLIEVVDGQDVGAVSLGAAARAAAWCDFLEAHARRIYQSAFDGDVEPAQRLADRIRESLPNPFTVRQAAQKGWKDLGTTEDVERAVVILEENDWVRRIEVPPGPEGGRPKTEIWINPHLATEAP